MMPYLNYDKALKYLDSFVNYEKSPLYPYKQSLKLERIEGFLDNLNNPQKKLKSIHIAGTKGKGSTCAFLASILRQAGFKTGLYTSPHLVDLRERIRILEPRANSNESSSELEGLIPRDELTALVERLKPDIDTYNSQSIYGPLTFFELYTVLAFEYFRKKEVDFAVLETGLGGRLDATNTVDSLIAAITPISYEHTQQLGGTLNEIAAEKAGIIKRHQVARSPGHQPIVITAPQQEEALGVIRQRCKELEAVLYEVGREIIFERTEACRDYQEFNLRGQFGEIPGLRIRLLGKHQVVNAALAAAIVLALEKFFKISVGLETISRGLYNTVWPGRFEIVSEQPWVALDGAQNAASAKALKETVIETFPGKFLVLVLGISKDKDIPGICRELCPLADQIILTQANNPRAADTAEIEKIIRNQGSEIRNQIVKAESVKEALGLAKNNAGSAGLIMVTGSLFLVGEARALLS